MISKTNIIYSRKKARLYVRIEIDVKRAFNISVNI